MSDPIGLLVMLGNGNNKRAKLMNEHGLVVFLLIVIVFVLLYQLRKYFFELGFLSKLTQQLKFLQFHQLSLKNLKIEHVPQKYRALYHVLSELLLFFTSVLETDKSTGLMNRIGAKRKLFSLMPLSQGTLILLNIHRLKYINDFFGYDFGDILVKSVGSRMVRLKQQANIVARMSESEFLLYYPEGITGKELKQIRGRLQVPYEVEGILINIRLHIGYLDVHHQGDLSIMLRQLDLALKKSAINDGRISSYCSESYLSHLSELEIINRLPKALQHNELYLVYQPKFDVKTGRCNEVEALVRWRHGELGDIAPDKFIPLAEQAGIIDILTKWVLDKVLSQQVLWRRSGINLQVAVNLSIRDLDRETLATEIATKLDQHDLPGDCLLIEITENLFIVDVEFTVLLLEKLRGLGVKLAIDDFGTGYSALTYLKRLPVDEVKIDKSFLDDLLEDPQAENIMELSIQLVQKMGFIVTVEGVETQDVYERLLSMGVDKLQGDWLSRPMDASKLEQQWSDIMHGVKNKTPSADPDAGQNSH